MQQYEDNYGIIRSRGNTGDSGFGGAGQSYLDKGVLRRRGRVGSSASGLRKAVYDIWGNVIKGEDMGGRAYQFAGPTGIDRWKAANLQGVPGALTPNIDAFKQQFVGRTRPRPNPESSGAYYSQQEEPQSQQLTSWGKRWEDAVQAARNQEMLRSQLDAERMQRYRSFENALDERRSMLGFVPPGGGAYSGA